MGSVGSGDFSMCLKRGGNTGLWDDAGYHSPQPLRPDRKCTHPEGRSVWRSDVTWGVRGVLAKDGTGVVISSRWTEDGCAGPWSSDRFRVRLCPWSRSKVDWRRGTGSTASCSLTGNDGDPIGNYDEATGRLTASTGSGQAKWAIESRRPRWFLWRVRQGRWRGVENELHRMSALSR